jgi:hypothetical protein
MFAKDLLNLALKDALSGRWSKNPNRSWGIKKEKDKKSASSTWIGGFFPL